MRRGGDTPRKTLIKSNYRDSYWGFGYIQDGTFHLAVNNYDLVVSTDSDGKVTSFFTGAESMLEQYWIPKLQNSGYQVENGELEKMQVEVNDVIPYWDVYEVIT